LLSISMHFVQSSMDSVYFSSLAKAVALERLGSETH
jgi:hypothetical protein